MHRIASIAPLALLVATFGVSTPVDTLAQESSSGQGAVVRVHWPDVVYETDGAMHFPDVRAAEQFTDTSVLPFLDTLAVSYVWGVMDGRPRIDFALRWVPGDGGILDGRPVPADSMPEAIELTLIDLTARVHVDGEAVGTLVLSLDSMAAPASPYEYVFETASVTWDDVFSDMSADASRRAFAQGFELRDLDVLRIGFESFETETVAERDDGKRDVPVVRRQPRRRAIFVPSVDVWLGWNIGRDPYGGSPRRTSGAYRPRTDRIGRTDTADSRRTRGGGSRTETPPADTESTASTRAPSRGAAAAAAAAGKKKDDKKDDDDRDLIGPALAGVAAVGALAYFGGTIGYFADLANAPIGLQSGRVGARGGLLVHAAVSPDVVIGGPDERLVVGANIFLRPVLARLHPTFGIDVWIEDDGTRRTADPTFTLGALLRTRGPLVLNLGVDVFKQRIQVGAALNLRWKQFAR